MPIKPYNVYEDEDLSREDTPARIATRKRINEFFKAYISHTALSPTDREQRLWPLETKDVGLDLLRGQESVHIGYIVSLSPHKTGAGSFALKWLCNLADTHNVVLELVVANPSGKNAKLSKAELTNWYKRNGFSGEPGDVDLVRHPLKSKGWPT